MASRKRRWPRIEELLELGQDVIGDTLVALDAVDEAARDRDYVYAVSEATSACARIAKEQREAVLWVSKHKPQIEEAHGFVAEYLEAVGDAQAREIVARLSARLAPS